MRPVLCLCSDTIIYWLTKWAQKENKGEAQKLKSSISWPSHQIGLRLNTALIVV